MWNIKQPTLSILLLTATLSASSQSLTTYSPYSRFGIGEVKTRGFANTKGMGALTQGIRNGAWINNLNPASYTAQDTMSFIFDFGVEGSGIGSKSSEQSNFNSTGNIHHLAIQFPLTRWMGVSAGIQPFSNVGYRIRHIETDLNLLSSIGPIKYYHLGKGGISQLYIGTAVEPFKNFSLGVNMSYLFGGLEYNNEIIFPNYSQYANIQKISSIVVRDIVFSFGAQYALDFGTEKEYRLVLGATLDNETSIGAKRIEHISYQSAGTNDTIYYREYPKSSIDFPSNISAGFSFAYKNFFMGGVEYATQDWSNAKFLNVSDSLTKSQSIRVGVQITPNPFDLRSYYKRISYRVGFQHTNTHIQLRGNQLRDYGISFGVGLPFRRTNSSFNLSMELGRKGTLEDKLVQETYGTINVGFTFYDFWFIKRRYN
jgi:hypothetical protein